MIELRIGSVDRIAPGACVVVENGDDEIAVFNDAGVLYAIDNRCAHNGGPLAEGTVRDGVVTCPRHWWRYHLDSGRRLGSDTIAQRSYEVRVDDGEVVITVPQSRPSRSIREQLLEHAKEWTREQ